MPFVKNLVKALKKDITIIIDLGPDEYSICHLTPYNEIKHGDLTIDNIFSVDETCIGIKVL